MFFFCWRRYMLYSHASISVIENDKDVCNNKVAITSNLPTTTIDSQSFAAKLSDGYETIPTIFNKWVCLFDIHNAYLGKNFSILLHILHGWVC